MIDYAPLYEALRSMGEADWAEQLAAEVPQRLNPKNHGDWLAWQSTLQRLPTVAPTEVRLDQASIRVGGSDSVDGRQRALICDLLQNLHPWRKGPFSIHGIDIDTEWRSDWKWDRLSGAISDLRGRRVLDVGCGNGYYAWRMLGAGARLVMGVDPSLRFVAQYQAMKHFLGDYAAYVLPLSLEDLPEGLGAFDSVFSMGVLYHRRSPFEHLFKLRDCLRPGGELVLETLVVERPGDAVLVPPGRYAQMRNVWFIPSPDALKVWLQRAGFRAVRVVDVTPTTVEEQRTTPWMRFHSLRDFLDPRQPGLTLEGLPAPVRAILIAQAPE